MHNTNDDSPVKVSLPGLLRLAQAGEHLALHHSRIRAAQSGGKLSPFRGRGMEFDESRPYQPGDDIRSLDWKVTARTGKTYTKLFREERERPVLLWLDLRQNMFFATRGVFKAVLAAKAAAVLGWNAASHRDRLGGLIFSEAQHQEIKPSGGKSGALRFLQTLTDHSAWETSSKPGENIQHNPEDSLLQACTRLHNVARPGSLVFLLSDFRGLTERHPAYLSQIAKHNDVILIYVHDPLELQLPPAGVYRVSDGQRELQIDTSSSHSATALSTAATAALCQTATLLRTKPFILFVAQHPRRCG